MPTSTWKPPREHLRVLGADLNHPTPIVENLRAGVRCNHRTAGHVAAGGARLWISPNPFTISDLSHVWMICDVYENDLPHVHVDEYADIRLNAYPDVSSRGASAISDRFSTPISAPPRSALEVENPGMLRLGMFVTGHVPRSSRRKIRAVVPASAVLHLHDRDWVYVPQDGHTFRRVEVGAGRWSLPAGRKSSQASGPGDRVVANALVLAEHGGAIGEHDSQRSSILR